MRIAVLGPGGVGGLLAALLSELEVRDIRLRLASLGTPETMEAAARTARARPLLKVKLGGAGDPDHRLVPEDVRAVHRGHPRHDRHGSGAGGGRGQGRRGPVTR